MLAICIYAHSTYFDILKIHLDYANKFYKDLPYDIYIFSDIPYNFGGGKRRKSKNMKLKKYSRKNSRKQRGGNSNIQSKIKTILYDDKTPFFQRLVHCIKQVNADYILLTTETQILIRFEKEIIKPLLNAMKNNKIDSIELLNLGSKGDIPIYNDLFITKKTNFDNYLIITDDYVFNLQNRLWLKAAALDIFSKFINSEYSSCEVGEIQNYNMNNQNTYTLYDKTRLISTKYGCYSPMYCVINIIRDGQFVIVTKDNKLSDLVQEEHEKIYNTYGKDSKRGINDFVYPIETQLRK